MRPVVTADKVARLLVGLRAKVGAMTAEPAVVLGLIPVQQTGGP